MIIQQTRLINNLRFFIILIALSACSDNNPVKLIPTLEWENPDDIKSGAALSEIQLNAKADIPGTFIYTPPIGSVLDIGVNQILSVEFTPSESDVYKTVSTTVSVNVIYNGSSEANFNPDLSYGTMLDTDGNNYQTIMVSGQVWMAENLRTTKYRNGDPIANVTKNNEWVALSSGSYASYDNQEDIDAIATHGLLYNWFAVSDSRNIAPEGWHVATQADWDALISNLGGSSGAGGKLKEIGKTHWNNPNTGATNMSGLTALPSGRREYTDGSFINTGFNGFWWSSSAYNPDYSWYYQLNYDTENIIAANFHKQYGFAVRCVKD